MKQSSTVELSMIDDGDPDESASAPVNSDDLVDESVISQWRGK